MSSGATDVQHVLLLESQLVAHVEPMIEDEQTPLGPAIGVEQTDVQAVSREVAFANTRPQETLEIDRIVWQEDSRRQELLKMVVHPSLGRTIDAVPADAWAVGRVVIHFENNPYQEYIDRACSTVWPLVPILGREAGLS